MNGMAVLQEIRELENKHYTPARKKVKIIMVTAHSDKDTIVSCIAEGCNDYIIKPFDKATVEKKLFPRCHQETEVSAKPLAASRTDTNVTANITALTYTAGAGGSISSVVTAVPNPGYRFVQWSDASTANPRTDTNVTTDLAVTARFASNTCTLTYNAGAGGSITGTTPQTVASGANGSRVTAVPSTGYRFVQWSDGVITASRTDRYVTADLNVTAVFAPSEPAGVKDRALYE
jgi:hypothetical protein